MNIILGDKTPGVKDRSTDNLLALIAPRANYELFWHYLPFTEADARAELVRRGVRL